MSYYNDLDLELVVLNSSTCIHKILGCCDPHFSSFTKGLRLLTWTLMSQPPWRGCIWPNNKQWLTLGRGQQTKVKRLISSVTVELKQPSVAERNLLFLLLMETRHKFTSY